MALPVLLMACLLLGPAGCDPSSTAAPEDTASTEPSDPSSTAAPEDTPSTEPGPPQLLTSAKTAEASLPTTQSRTSATLDEVIVELAGFYQATARAAIAGPLAELTNDLTNTLANIQESVVALSRRLDASQLQQQNAQTDLAEKLDALSARVDAIEASQTFSSQTLANIQESFVALSGRLDASQLQQQNAQTDLAEKVDALSASLDAIEASQCALSGRVNSSLQDQLDAIQAAVVRIPKIVLGKDCNNDTDCSRILPEAVCGSGGRCQCREGFRQVSDVSCRQTPRLSEWCVEDADCKILVNSTICSRSVCSCANDFWNYNDAECRPISAVNMGSSCVGDQDCDSSLHLQCVTGTCSCPVETMEGYQYRLTGGDACNEGNVELKREGGYWGVVCDDSWGANDAGVICRSLGFRTGDPTIKSQFGRATRFYMDEVQCGGSESHLRSCNYAGWGSHDCGGGEVAGARCRN